MRRSQHVLEHYFGYVKAICLLLLSGFSSAVAAQHTPSEITLDNVDDTSELRSLHASGKFSPRVSIALDSGELVYLELSYICLLYTSPSPRDRTRSRMPSSA